MKCSQWMDGSFREREDATLMAASDEAVNPAHLAAVCLAMSTKEGCWQHLVCHHTRRLIRTFSRSHSRSREMSELWRKNFSEDIRRQVTCYWKTFRAVSPPTTLPAMHEDCRGNGLLRIVP